MKQQNEKRHGRTNGWLFATGIAVLFALAFAPALTGSAAAAAPSANVAPAATQWAYGGQGNASGNLQVGSLSVTWNATFGWTVVFTATNTSNTTVMVEEQRTVGLYLTTSLTTKNLSATYTYHGTESDLAFVNLTTNATVYVNGTPVPALGILNENLHVQATVDQSIQVALHGLSRSGFLNVSGTAQGQVSFTPALGLIPLNLTGIGQWNSSATSNPSASWNINYAWADQGWNGTTRSGSGTIAGNWTASGPVSLIGFKVTVVHPFIDHKARTGVILLISGPVDAYDGYILIPHAFDLFGGAAHPYDAESFGSATVGSGQGETLYVSDGARGPSVTAADSSFSGSPGAGSSLAQPVSGVAPASASDPGTTVYGQPMSVASAQAEAACLIGGCSAAAKATGSLLGIAVIALAVVAVVGTVAVIEWRSYARRRSQKGLVGGYGESWTNGVPPTGAQGPTPPTEAPQGPEGPRTLP